MIDEKELFGIKVWNVASEYNLTQTAVHSIINEFVETCRRLVVSGFVVRLQGLATIIPNEQLQQYIPTLGFISKIVSDTCGITYYTVYTVINAYLESVESDILIGKNVDIRKLISFHSIFVDSNKFKVNCFMSASLRNELRVRGVETGARASLNKMLRNKIKEGVA